MKRFMIFTMLTYYPEGGLLDYHSSSDTLESAVEAANAAVKANGHDDWNILDRETGEAYEMSTVDSNRIIKLQLKEKP